MGLFTALSIFVHNFPEGLATFVRRRTTALLSCYLGAISARGEARRIMLIHQLSRSAGPVLSSGPDHDHVCHCLYIGRWPRWRIRTRAPRWPSPWVCTTSLRASA